jgi:hypothetical protein
MTGKSSEEILLQHQFEAEPASDAFYFYASAVALRSRTEAREILFKGLTLNINHVLGRFLLAKLFFMDGFTPFAVRELKFLDHIHSVPALKRLLQSLGSEAETERETKQNQQEKVIADIDIEADLLEVLEEIEGK